MSASKNSILIARVPASKNRSFFCQNDSGRKFAEGIPERWIRLKRGNSAELRMSVGVEVSQSQIKWGGHTGQKFWSPKNLEA